MKLVDIAGLTEVELKNKISQLRKEQFDARMKNALGQLANPMVIRAARRNIARLHTALCMKAQGKVKG
jgi:large subunit ribosomal protein L29